MVPKECGFNKVHRIRESPSFIPAPVNLGSNLAGGGGNRGKSYHYRPYAAPPVRVIFSRGTHKVRDNFRSIFNYLF